jgi:protease-4
VSSRYFGKALERLGIQPKVMARGEYKSAGETFMRESMSEPQRKQLEELLEQMYAALIHGVSAGRGMTRERAIELIDSSPHRPQAAVDLGLIDGAAYEDELPALLGSRERPATILAASRYTRATRPLIPWPRRRSLCAVVQVHGPIVSSSSSSPGIAGDDHIIAAIRAARAAPSIRAVILHVDSPGGSALASDRIHHELVQLAAEKPLVACLANVAASGGYYVAAASSHVIAEPTTITGSIGVVAARFVIEPLLEKWGIKTEVVKRGARAGLLDPLKPLSDDEEAAIDGEIGATYDAFVDVVAQGRGKSREQVEELARGRVWSGADAHTHGLVDELGGFETAVRYASARAGRDLEPVVVRPFRSRIPPLTPPSSPARALLDLFSGERVLAISDVATWIFR